MDRLIESSEEREALENELRQSLRHVPAPSGFTDRVMARVAEREGRAQKPGRSLSFMGTRHHGAWWAGIAAALVMAVGGGDALHVHHLRQAREAAAAQAQMDMAMQLTNHALNEVEIGFDHSPAGRFAKLWNGTEK